MGGNEEASVINTRPKCRSIRALPRSIKITFGPTNKTELASPTPLPARPLFPPRLLQRREAPPQPDFSHPLPISLNSITAYSKIYKPEHDHSDRDPAVENPDTELGQVDDDPPGGGVVGDVPGVGEPSHV